MKPWKKITLLALGTIFLLTSAAIGAFKYVSHKMVELHQKSVTRSIVAWGDEYSQIRSEADVTKAVEMMEYISRYYVTPHPGYKGTAASEQKLEEQRALALLKLRSALEKYTGRNYGTNLQPSVQWKDGTEAKSPK
jgi:hypothetical protein